MIRRQVTLLFCFAFFGQCLNCFITFAVAESILPLAEQESTSHLAERQDSNLIDASNELEMYAGYTIPMVIGAACLVLVCVCGIFASIFCAWIDGLRLKQAIPFHLKLYEPTEFSDHLSIPKTQQSDRPRSLTEAPWSNPNRTSARSSVVIALVTEQDIPEYLPPVVPKSMARLSRPLSKFFTAKTHGQETLMELGTIGEANSEMINTISRVSTKSKAISQSGKNQSSHDFQSTSRPIANNRLSLRLSRPFSLYFYAPKQQNSEESVELAGSSSRSANKSNTRQPNTIENLTPITNKLYSRVSRPMSIFYAPKTHIEEELVDLTSYESETINTISRSRSKNNSRTR
ncbi:hypothetical protein HK096_000136 [Nowakowskiella sp. JEL0078]|nr:hypothetical protein HK096_000136 [Nowakowskiella sp. JEL0078]